MATVNMLARILLIVGGLNWGLVGAFNMDLVQKLLGGIMNGPMVVYILVGLAALWEAYNWCFCAKK